MLKYFLSLILLLNGLGSISAQSAVKYSYNFNSTQNKQNIFTGDTLKILAVLADFQIDRDEATFGNGKFGSIYSKDYGTTILDPLPHDKSYFEKHLDFVKNYYQKVSKNKLVIKFTVLPGITTVSKTMRNYSPAFNSTSFLRLGDFAKEVWEKTSLSNPNFDFSRFNLFIIFHAGAGKEISLPGSLGIEKDLPSLFLSKISLKEIYGQNFSGFTLSNSTFKITNTMIMPETENREAENILGVSLVQLSINGLLAANVGSFIGLPDLFNTVTGQSAIGRFGLMDGESFFSFKGLFPPEPSAWEKIKLGWAKSVDLIPGDYDINLISNLAASLSDTVILKVPISPKEYYLIENRNRDVNKDGAVVTYIVGGDTLQKFFLNDSNSFSNISSDSLQGVIIDVDEFDWALPGNGILIWHVDENIIDSKIDSNLINADKNNKGIFLEEADGIFDIGERFVTILGDVIIGQGTEDDFWFSNNTSKFYTNKFAPDTRPSSNSNKGANSLITISNFSNISNNMSFHISYGDSVIVPKVFTKLNLNSKNNHLSFFQRQGAGTPLINPGDKELQYILLSGKTLNILNNIGEIDTSISNFSNFKPALFDFTSNQIIIGVIDSTINLLVSDINGKRSNYKINISNTLITAPPVILRFDLGAQYMVLLGTNTGEIFMYDLNSMLTNSPHIIGTFKQGNITEVIQIAAKRNVIATVGKTTSNQYGYFNNGFYSLGNEKPNNLVLSNYKNGKTIGIVKTENHIKSFIDDSLVVDINISEFGKNISNVSLTDLGEDNNVFITFTADNKIEVINVSGSERINFPFINNNNINFSSGVLNANISGNDDPELIAVTNDGRIVAIDGSTGKMINNFPIKMGKLNSSTILFHKYIGFPSFAAIDTSNNFYVWKISNLNYNPIWNQELGNGNNTSYLPITITTSIAETFLPKNKVYNYPNPVYGNSTKIRYFVSEDSKINIKIFDIAGGYVTELNDFAIGGLDNETTWDVSNIQSGIYLVRVEAISSRGQSDTKIIKIAVVK